MESIQHFGKVCNNSFKDKNVLITGATGGIGSKVTQALAQLGANIIATTRYQERIFESLGNLTKSNNFNYEVINLENPKAIRDGFVKIMKKFDGRIDIIIICHAIFKVGGIKDTDRHSFDESLNINVRSIFQIVSMATPFMKLSKGNIVIMSSLESFIPVSNSFLNSLSKV